MELRAYFFGNMYLSSIQQGIQAAHVISDMFVKYDEWNTRESDLLWEWAEDHKTMILLNAGYGNEIHDLVEFFGQNENNFPFECFCEAEEALDGAITSVGIILPKYIWEGSKQLRNGSISIDDLRTDATITYAESTSNSENSARIVEQSINKWEFDLIQRLNNYGLAR